MTIKIYIFLIPLESTISPDDTTPDDTTPDDSTPTDSILVT